MALLFEGLEAYITGGHLCSGLPNFTQLGAARTRVSFYWSRQKLSRICLKLYL
jgi:hypothetical protein